MEEQKNEKLELRNLQLQLKEAMLLIDKNNISEISNTCEDEQGLRNAESLLERCWQVVKKKSSDNKPLLRIIHHFACSGGTLISKCIAAQPNVFLLSELHPTTRLGFNAIKGTYTPRDLVTQAFYAGVPEVNTLAEQIFVRNIIHIEKHIRELGGYLVLRAHTHSDYCTDEALPDVDTLTYLLSPHFEIKHLITLRNPIDSFLSLRQNGWVNFKPDSFDSYCKRLLKFLEPFSLDQIIKYEEFVDNPHNVLLDSAKILQLEIVDYGLDYLEIFKISGDSGRSSSEIATRPRKDISCCYKNEILESPHFEKFKKSYGYVGI